MSSKFTEFDPLSALFRDFSDSDQDVPEPLRFEQDSQESEDNTEVTTQIIPLKTDLYDDDSDEDIVEPLVVTNAPPVLSPSDEEDETEQIIMKRKMPPRRKGHDVSQAKKSNLAREMIATALQKHEAGETPNESADNVTSKTKEVKGKARWKKYNRPKSALEMALELAAEEDAPSSEEEPTVEEQTQSLQNQPNHSATGSEKDELSSSPEKVDVTDEADEADEAELVDENVLLRDHVASILQPIFPNLENYSVVRAIYADDRKLFEVLWKSHRSKFIYEGRLEYAIATLSVINALKTAPKNDLVAAHLETSATDYLVWIRPSNGDVLAAFQDARQYFA